MPSKTSFCNGTEFRKCLSRWWPLWVIYGVILFILLPGVLLNARSTIPYVSTEQISYLSNVILSETQMLLPLTAFCAGLLAAAAMFGYLYTPRSAGLAASLPIKRGCMFRTHLLAGLVMLLSAEAVIFGLAVLIEATRFELVIEPLLIWLGILALETVVFYGIAVLCAMFTGHVVMLPCLYLLVNFIAVGFQLLVEAVLYTFVYGMSGMADLPVDWLSPLVLFMRRTSVGHADLVRPISGTEAEVAIANFSGWIYPLVWAAFALLLLVCAGQLYRRRRMESAGDTVAIPVLKPVLKYIVALFAGLALPVGVYGMLLNVPAYRAHLAPFLLLAVLGARSALSSARWSSASPCASRARSGAAARSQRPCAVSSWSAQSVTSRAMPAASRMPRRSKARASSATATTPRSPRRRTFRPWRTSTAPSWRSAKRSRTTPASPVCS